MMKRFSLLLVFLIGAACFALALRAYIQNPATTPAQAQVIQDTPKPTKAAEAVIQEAAPTVDYLATNVHWQGVRDGT